ncbi:MAG: Flp pilus assembly protein CpaB [Pyrinomonadaceae bacterium]|nr:Flp pilus assembly protein CpaB [Pyrinomonadaceae bacterium]
MRNKRLLLVLACAVIFGIVAATLVSRYLSTYALAYNKNFSRVIISKTGIPLGSKITAEQLASVQFPRNATPDGVYEAADKLIGRVAITNIAAREPITDFKLAPEGTAGGLSAVIPEGYRAITVKVDDVVGISGFVMPGSLVDVVVVIDPPANVVNGSSQGRVSKIVLQNIKVLANGQNIDRPKNDRDASNVTAVTLQVTPEQAEKLALAVSEGRLQLVMRNSTDQDDAPTPGANKRSLLSGEQAVIVPEAGSYKSEQQSVAPGYASARAGVSSPRRAPVKSSNSTADAVALTAPTPLPRRSVELYEGAKKRDVDFP